MHEQMRQMQQQQQEQMQQQQGSITIESKDQPASWKAPDETKGNGSAPAGSAA